MTRLSDKSVTSEQRMGLWASFVCLLAIALGNASYLLGFRSNDPLLYESGLGSPTQGTSKIPFTTIYSNYPVPSTYGDYTIDPNNGWTVQALGRLSARMWAHGHIPLWNTYEGLGQPLAGEMQSAALFLPFVLFQLLPQGTFAMHLALQVVAGLSTLAFLRTMRLSWTASMLGGVLFALNGAFSVMTNAPFNPLAFLPMALWGVELVARAAQEGRRPRCGMWVIAVAIAWMLFAGFPETALLEALFIAVWFAARWVDLKGVRRDFALWSILGGVAGLLLALPILVSIKGFLGFGYTAYHAGESAHWFYQPKQFAGLALHYGQGALGRSDVSKGMAGYVTLGSLTLACIGLFSARSRWVKGNLLTLILIFTLNAFGLSVANTLLNAIPGMRSVLLYKYGLLVIEFGVIVLAAFGIDDIVSGRMKKRALAVGAFISFFYLALALIIMQKNGGFPDHPWSIWVVVLTVFALIGVAVCSLLARRPRLRQSASVVVALFVAGEATATFAVPQITSSAPSVVDMAPVHYLQENLGTSRFYTTGPIEANYGSYWGISQLNVNDLPIPQKFSEFIMSSLKPDAGTPLERATSRAFLPYELSPLNFSQSYAREIFTAYLKKQHAFREAGVKYVVTQPGVTTDAAVKKYGLSRVFSDDKAVIWKDASAKPYFETDPNCSVREEDLSAATVSCAQPSTLLRRQLASPDWHVTINGTKYAVDERPDGLFQSIKLPAGTSRVEFTYIPKYFQLASGISLFVVAGMLLDAAFYLRSWRKNRITNSI